MGAFSDSIAANSAKILETVNSQCYDIAYSLFNDVINQTPSPEFPSPDGAPYAKGELVNQWYPVDGPSFSTEVSGALSDDGTDSRERLNDLYGSTFLGKDGAVTMTNNVPYSGLAEIYGWNHTPPYRMVAIALQLAVMSSRIRNSKR